MQDFLLLGPAETTNTSFDDYEMLEGTGDTNILPPLFKPSHEKLKVLAQHAIYKKPYPHGDYPDQFNSPLMRIFEHDLNTWAQHRNYYWESMIHGATIPAAVLQAAGYDSR